MQLPSTANMLMIACIDFFLSYGMFALFFVAPEIKIKKAVQF